jgi:hypothetical protein
MLMWELSALRLVQEQVSSVPGPGYYGNNLKSKFWDLLAH